METLQPGTDLCNIPAGRPPSGLPDFENPHTLEPISVSVTVVLLIFSAALVLGRVHNNFKRLHRADWCVVIALVINIAFTGVVLAQHRFFRHQWDIPVCWFTGRYFKILFAQVTLFAPVFLTSKAAIFLLYRQIFDVKRHVRIAINFGLFFTCVLYLPNIPLAAIYQAPAAGGTWQSMLMETKGRKVIIWGLVQSSFSIALDIYIFVLPLPTIAKLHLPLSRRLQITGVFTTALIGIVASILSLVYRIKLLNTMDTTWWSTIVTICAYCPLSVVEINVAIIVSCMPSLAHLLKLYAGGPKVLILFMSKLLRPNGSGGSGPSNCEDNKDDKEFVATIGTKPGPRQQEYHVLKDDTLLTPWVGVSRNSALPESEVISSQTSSHGLGKGSAERLV